MKLRGVIPLLVVSLLLAGCGGLDGTYVSVTPHRETAVNVRAKNLEASNYQELQAAMEEVVSKGTENCVINLADYDPALLEAGLRTASRYVQKMYPLGAYAVESVHYEVGSNSGKTAVALDVTYRHGWMEIRKIQKAKDLEDVVRCIGRAMEDYETVLVIDFADYEKVDYSQIVQDYALRYPQRIMEVPQITAEVHGVGLSRVVELLFSYQTSREALRNMQTQVQPVFASADLYVSGEGTQQQKFSQLYAFLMERFDYTVETSITPAYSLLRHGVGDSRAFATVYAAMCREAELECLVVTGTRFGERRAWNIICEDGVYRHVDLLRCSEAGLFLKLTDEDMDGYVWDYSAYPACVSVPEESNDVPEMTE